MIGMPICKSFQLVWMPKRSNYWQQNQVWNALGPPEQFQQFQGTAGGLLASNQPLACLAHHATDTRWPSCI